MDIGMLWFDDTKQPLANKVKAAADYYQLKYGQPATSCHVHPSMLAPDGAAVIVGAIRVQANRTVNKHHFWLGVELAG